MREVHKMAIVTAVAVAVGLAGTVVLAKRIDAVDLREVRAHWAQTCIKNVMAEEFRLRPKDNPERLSIVVGCTDSGFLLYPVE